MVAKLMEPDSWGGGEGKVDEIKHAWRWHIQCYGNVKMILLKVTTGHPYKMV